MHINRTGDINNVKTFEVFSLYANTNMADTWIVCPIYTGTSSRAQLDGLVVSVSDFGARGTNYNFFFFFLFSLVMQNYFIHKQVIWNYINDKNYTP